MAQVPTEKLAQARALMDTGRYDEARAHLLHLLRRAPNDPIANVLLSVLLSGSGQIEQAIFYAKRATAAAPESAESWLALGLARIRSGQSGGMDDLRRAVAVNPQHTESRLVLGETLRTQMRNLEAIALYREGVRVDPTGIQIAINLACTMHAMGRTEDALEALEGMPAGDRAQASPASALAQLLNYAPGISPERVFAAHRQIEASLRLAGIEPLPPPPRPRDPERRLRIGVLSAELVGHSVAYFLEPLLAGLDPAQFELVAYSATPSTDAISERFRKLMPTWHDVKTSQGPGLATQIRGDQIDILIETTAVTNIARLVALLMRAAPIQITCMGYPATTGLSTVDYRVVDSLTDPPGAEAYAAERLLRLDPCFLCYRPITEPPLVRPRDPDAPLTFGSFNTLLKLNEPLIRLWVRVLDAVPGSRLVLKSWALTEAETRDDIASRFAAAGCGPDRLVLMPARESRTEHLGQYHGIDVGLDPFPYHGTTTTCEAILMGVPVVSLQGQTHASRVGVSLLHAIGHGELVAQSEEQYVAIAASLMKDGPRLAGLRADLRGRLMGSPLCDEEAYAARFAAALRNVWREACAAG